MSRAERGRLSTAGTAVPATVPADGDAARAAALRRALVATPSSVRLQAALGAGTRPDPAYPQVLIDRAAVEPDFFVREMLTWALVRHPSASTVPLLLAELSRVAAGAQARSQSLHTLSKIADPTAWSAITDRLLCDPDEEVARSAWRAAAALVPAGGEARLASRLVAQLGRGDGSMRQSLSRAFVALGEQTREALEVAGETGPEPARLHAAATVRLLDDPDEGFESAVFEARRLVALRDGGVEAGPRAHR